jgi:flagellar biosynthesis chaperone FliJ
METRSDYIAETLADFVAELKSERKVLRQNTDSLRLHNQALNDRVIELNTLNVTLQHQSLNDRVIELNTFIVTLQHQVARQLDQIERLKCEIAVLKWTEKRIDTRA